MPRPVHVGDLIGAVFGAIFVAANSQILGLARVPLVVLAIAAVVTIALAFSRSRTDPGANGPPMNRRAYLVVVAIEVVALVVGGIVIAALVPQISVAWVAFVVGLHFVAFAIWWLPGSRVFTVIGGLMSALAVVGFVIGLVGGAGSVDVVALVAGVGSGLVLLVPSTTAAVQRLRA